MKMGTIVNFPSRPAPLEEIQTASIQPIMASESEARPVVAYEPDPAWFHWVLWPAAFGFAVLACWLWPQAVKS